LSLVDVGQTCLSDGPYLLLLLLLLLPRLRRGIARYGTPFKRSGGRRRALIEERTGGRAARVWKPTVTTAHLPDNRDQ